MCFHSCLSFLQLWQALSDSSDTRRESTLLSAPSRPLLPTEEEGQGLLGRASDFPPHCWWEDCPGDPMALLALTHVSWWWQEKVPEVRFHSLCWGRVGALLSIINLPCKAAPFLGLWPGKPGSYRPLWLCGISELPVISLSCLVWPETPGDLICYHSLGLAVSCQANSPPCPLLSEAEAVCFMYNVQDSLLPCPPGLGVGVGVICICLLSNLAELVCGNWLRPFLFHYVYARRGPVSPGVG